MNKLRNLLRPKVLITGFVAAVILALGIGLGSQQTAFATTCPGRDSDNNAIIKCGYDYLGAGSDGFTTKFNQNAGELQAIYSHFGFTSLSDFTNNAKHVTVYRDGTAKTDDGTVVGTGANSLGRQSFGKSTRLPININGKTYYYSTTANSYAAGVNSIDGYAIFNSDDHSMVMGTMKACGNPFWANSPGYKCQMLQQTKVNDTTYNYVATPFVKNGATVSRIVYDFGDGQSQPITSNFAQVVSHKYAPGDYTARATVYFSVNGKEQSDTRVDCTKPVHVPQPPKPVFTCTELVAVQVKGSRTKYTFTAGSHVENGAILESGTFKFDDHTSATVDATGSTVSVVHEYVETGNHVTSVDLTFNDGKDIGNTHCVITVPIFPATCADTPSKPECLPQPPKTCADTPNLPECQPPKTCATNPEMAQCQVLPSTGPEEVVSTVLGLSTVTGASVYYRNTRRDLLSKIFKR